MTESLRTQRSRELRRDQTPAEYILWLRLRNRQLSDLKFRRQHPLYGFILDFYCYEVQLAIELDGNVHQNQDQIEQDNYRTEVLKEKGVTLLRFWNSEVTNNIEKVLKRIEDVAKYLVSIKRIENE